MINGQVYHTFDIKRIVRLQKMIREFLERRRAVKNYMQICPPELGELDSENVKKMLGRYGPFRYMAEKDEGDMNF